MAPTVAEPFNDSLALIDFVINQGNGVKGLSEMGLKALPKQYIQPLEERMCMTNGFFQIVNHDVPVEVLENVNDATYKFFGLPAEVKISTLRNIHRRTTS
ncbi:hypothetical protein Gotur_004768, partial [Gossypium turneri]